MVSQIQKILSDKDLKMIKIVLLFKGDYHNYDICSHPSCKACWATNNPIKHTNFWLENIMDKVVLFASGYCTKCGAETSDHQNLVDVTNIIPKEMLEKYG